MSLSQFVCVLAWFCMYLWNRLVWWQRGKFKLQERFSKFRCHVRFLWRYHRQRVRVAFCDRCRPGPNPLCQVNGIESGLVLYLRLVSWGEAWLALLLLIYSSLLGLVLNPPPLADCSESVPFTQMMRREMAPHSANANGFSCILVQDEHHIKLYFKTLLSQINE